MDPHYIIPIKGRGIINQGSGLAHPGKEKMFDVMRQSDVTFTATGSKAYVQKFHGVRGLGFRGCTGPGLPGVQGFWDRAFRSFEA